MKKPSLKIEEIEAISNGSHGNVFAVLGLHEVGGDETNPSKPSEPSKPSASLSLIVRAFRPDAKRVWLIPERGKEVELKPHGGLGYFEAHLPRRKQRFHYRFRVEPYHGETYEIEDPYAFGPQLSDFDLQLWGEGNHHHTYRWMGAHKITVDGVEGTRFTVAAPNAARVSVVGPFNQWDGRVHGMRHHPAQGLWEIFLPHVTDGDIYKFEIKTAGGSHLLLKSDPYAQYAELRPETASVVWSSSYEWADDEWMTHRPQTQSLERPISIYEVHAGSWRRHINQNPGYLSWHDLAEQLIPYVKEMGFTHIELMPVAEHPYDPSWGYQITGYFAPTSRYGNPDDLRFFVDQCHQAGIGVIIDWVPAHFAKDAHGLQRFDGTALYEHEDPRKGEHRDWGTHIFNYSRREVLNFLLSNAIYWLEEFHIDGLRVDAVASMLYLDYSREDGEWIPNIYGGRENLEAISFLRQFNDLVHYYHPGVLTFAEESTSWQGVSRPTSSGGLGFDLKWNMGWMNDTLDYIEKDPVYRRYHQDQLSFSMIYAFTEQFMLPLSHDEVVHMKQSLLSKMPGDDWQKFANLRLLYMYMYGHPGKKLLFMGSEFGQWDEWSESKSLDWHLTQWDRHRGVQRLLQDLNRAYQAESSMHEVDFNWQGFEWIDISDADNSLLTFIRKAKNSSDYLLFILNFTPNTHSGYKIGVPEAREYRIILNSDSSFYGGSNVGDTTVMGMDGSWQSQGCHAIVRIPPLAGMILKPV